MRFHNVERGVNPEAVAEAYHAFEQGSGVAPLTAAAISNQTIQESMRLLLLVRAYQVGIVKWPGGQEVLPAVSKRPRAQELYIFRESMLPGDCVAAALSSSPSRALPERLQG